LPSTVFDHTKGRTQQHFKEECDINTIVRRFLRTGTVPADMVKTRLGTFLDTTAFGDFQTAQQTVIEARNAFMTLPADTRAKFNNNPGELVDWINDPNNKDEAIRLNLLPGPAPKPEPVPESKP